MYWSKEKQSKGMVYRFFYYDEDGKKCRLSVDQTPHFDSDAEADKFCSRWDAEKDAKRARAMKRLNWRKRYYNFEGLSELFLGYLKEHAPNSYQMQHGYFNHYVLSYFLGVREVPNLDLWPEYFLEFREYLKTVHKVQTRKKVVLSWAGKNHAITSLNNFLKFAWLSRWTQAKLPSCPRFPDHLEGERTAEDLVSEEEFEKIAGELKASSKDDVAQDLSNLYRVLYHTGMRISEALGLSFADFFKGDVPKEEIAEELKRNKMECYGYIILLSQLDGVQTDPYEVIRKPLKTRKTMKEKDGRVIPITDKKIFNILAKYWNKSRKDWEKRKYGSEESNYLFFKGLSKNMLNGRVRTIYKKLGLHFKPPHCLRHTRSTILIGKSMNFILAKLILGHNSKSYLRYCHIFEETARLGKKKEQSMEDMELLEED